MTDLFKELLPSILQNNNDVLENEKDYVPFVVNNAVAHHKDCIFWVNEINQRPWTDKRMQYDFLRKAIKKYKRPYVPWIKKEGSQYLEAVMEHFKLSEAKALETISVLTNDQLELVLKACEKGGPSANGAG